MKQTERLAWRGKSRGGSWGLLCFILTIKYLGTRAAYLLLLFVVPYFFLFSPKSTSAVWDYSRRVLKCGRLRSFFRIFLHYYRFGQTLIDKIAINGGLKSRYWYDFENYDEFLDILNAKQGVVMIGAHIGNWEIGAPFFCDYGRRINIVMYDAEYQKIKDVLDKSSTKNYKVISIGEDFLECIIKIKSALDGGESVCFQGDRYMNANSTLSHLFMGGYVNFPAGPFLVASRMNVPVVFYFAMRQKGCGYKFHFVVGQQPDRQIKLSPEQQILNQYVDVLEKMVERYPSQWFNFYKYWS